MNLASPEPVEVACESCGRLFDVYDATIHVRDGTKYFDFHRRGQEGKDWMIGPGRLEERGGRVTGRHREHRVVGRDDKPAFRFECGCGHRRTIGAQALKDKLERAPVPQIRL